MTIGKLAPVAESLELVKKLAALVYDMDAEQRSVFSYQLRSIEPVNTCDEPVMFRCIAQYVERL